MLVDNVVIDFKKFWNFYSCKIKVYKFFFVIKRDIIDFVFVINFIDKFNLFNDYFYLVFNFKDDQLFLFVCYLIVFVSECLFNIIV